MVKRSLALVVLVALVIMLMGSTSAAADGGLPSDTAPGAEMGASAFFRIDNDDDLKLLASINGWDDQGRDGENKPFLIDGTGWSPDAQGNYSGFYIGNTTLDFIITNWQIFNCTMPPSAVDIYSPGAAVVLFNVTGPCSIETSNLSDNPIGAWVESSTNITISEVECRNTTGPGLLVILSDYASVNDNQLQNNSIGISLDRSNRSLVSSNICSMGAQGISSVGSSNGSFEYNNCSQSGLGLNASHLVDSTIENNTFNEDAVGIAISASRNLQLGWNIIWTSQNGIDIEVSEGIDVIHNSLISCSAVGIRSNDTAAPHDISWNILAGTTPVGISLSNSTSTMVRNNTINGSADAMILQSVSSGLLRDNQVSNSQMGTLARDCPNLVVVANRLNGCSVTGLELVRCSSSLIQNNTFTNCQKGIRLQESSLSARIIGNEIKATGSTGILIQGASINTLMTENIIRDQTSAGIQVSNGNGAVLNWNLVDGCAYGILVQWTSEVEASNNTCSNGGKGIEFNGTSAASIKYNVCQGNAQAGIYLSSLTSSTILRNNCSNNIGSGIFAILGTGNKIDNNEMFGNGIAGIRVVSESGLQVTFNRQGGSTLGIGIYVRSSLGLVASNNTCLDNSRGMEINGTTYASIKDNRCQGNTQAGIYLHTTSPYVPTTITGNNCSYNPGSGIVAISGPVGNKFEGNSLFGNGMAGLRATREVGLQINLNRIGGNGAWGVRLDSCMNPRLIGNSFDSDSIGILISGESGAYANLNEVKRASKDGLVLSSTNTMVFFNNTIQGCVGYAVNASGSSGSRFYLNVFINNNGTSSAPSPSNRQARDDSANDVWSFSFNGQLLGNYWSDKTTPDADRDGTVDTPYLLVGKASDLKPLSGPLGPVTNADYKKGKTYVHLTWRAPNYTAYAPLTSYYIVRMNSTSTVSFTLAPGQTEYNDTSISSTSDYTYDILARSSIGSSVIISFDVPRSDMVKPTVEITNPAQDDQLNNTLIVASWTGSDPEPSSGIARYEVSMNSGAWLDVGTNTSYPLPTLAQGTHTFAVRVTDREGNSNQSSVQFYVDAWSPVLVINLPLPGTIQNQTSVLVRWTATDNGTGIKGYQFRVDSGSWSPLQAQNQTSLVMSPGAHIINVRAFDLVDLVQTISSGLIVDPYAPVITITSPSKTDLRNKNVHLAWSGIDNITSIVGYEVRVDSGAWVSMGLNLSYDVILSEGGHSLSVRGQDQAGNYGTAQLNVTMDLTGPQVEILSPANGTYVNKRNVVIVWSVVSSGSPLAWSEVRLDETLWINASTALTYTTPSLAEGLHMVEVRSYDQAGNSGSNSTSFQVDTVAPVVDWFYPSYGLILSTDYVVMLWNASDDRSGLNTTFVLVDSLDPLEIGLSTEFNVTSLAQGGHMIGVRVYDVAGNYRVGQVGIYVDLTPPKVTITYPLEGQIVQGREINVMWTASDVGSGLWYFYASRDGVFWIDLGYTFSHVFTGFSDGRHSIYIKAFDRAYNTGIGTANFTVDFSQPVVVISYPVTGGWINSTSFEARWSGSDSPLGMDHFEVRLDGGNWTSVGLDTAYRFDGLNYSSHVLEVKGVSNSSQETVARSTFGIDIFAPSSPMAVQPALYVGNGRISFSWGASLDNASGILGYQVRTMRTYFNGSAYATEIGPWVEVGTSLSYASTGNLDGWYNVSVRAKDRAGNIGPEDTVQLILDSVPPLASSYGPLGTSVSISAVITVTFSEPMVTGSVRVYIAASGTISWEGDTILRYTPTGPFPYNATYNVEVAGRDLAGNSMTPLLWQFRTQPNLGTLTGKVLDDLNAPIQGALVSLENGQTATTDRDGEFSIIAPSGTHTLTIRYEGYSDIQVNVTLSAGETTDIGSAPLSKAGTDFSWVIILTFVLLVAVAIELAYLQRKRKK